MTTIVAHRGASHDAPENTIPAFQLAWQQGADAFSSSKTISESFAGKIMEHGYPWHVWTVDDPEQAARFQQWGTASITTNIPGVIRQIR